MRRAAIAVVLIARVASAKPVIDTNARPSAKLAMAKQLFDLGYPAVALELLQSLHGTPDERHAAIAEVEAFAERVDTPTSRYPLRTLSPADIDELPVAMRDDVRYHAGRSALDGANAARGYQLLALVSPASKWRMAAQVAIHANDLAIERASQAPIVVPHEPTVLALVAVARGPDPIAAREAIWALADFASYAAAMASGDNAPPPENAALFEHLRGMLEQLAHHDATAALAVSRFTVRNVPRLWRVDARTVAAVATGSGCVDGATRDARVRLAETIAGALSTILSFAELDDNAALADAVERGLSQTPTTSSGSTVHALMATPEVREARAWRAEVTLELDRVKHADKTWQTTDLGMQALQALTIDVSLASSELGTVERRALDLARTQLRLVGEAIDQAADDNIAIPIGRTGLVVSCPAPAIAVTPVVHARGCGGCASGGDAGLVVGLVALSRRRRATRAR